MADVRLEFQALLGRGCGAVGRVAPDTRFADQTPLSARLYLICVNGISILERQNERKEVRDWPGFLKLQALDYGGFSAKISSFERKVGVLVWHPIGIIGKLLERKRQLKTNLPEPNGSLILPPRLRLSSWPRPRRRPRSRPRTRHSPASSSRPGFDGPTTAAEICTSP